MSRLIDEALAASHRWRDQQPAGPLPVIRIVLVNSQVWYFNGLSVAPSLQTPAVAVVSSAGLGGETLIVRDEDIFLIEIQPLGA
jgi:hypothetical protein